MYDPIRRNIKEENLVAEHVEETDTVHNHETEDVTDKPQWKDDEDRVANWYITGDELYDKIPLPKIIKLRNCTDGEITLMEKRSFPKVVRMHRKREDNNPHKFFEHFLYIS